MATEQWHPDILITEALVKTSIETQFPALAPINSIQCIGEGWDNKVFLVNNQIIFRFPHRQIAVELLERENNILKNLHEKFSQATMPLEIPNPVYIGVSPVGPFQGYHIIKGVSGCHARLTEEERIASLPVLSLFLKQLHSISEKQAVIFGGKPQVFDRTNVKTVVEALNERVEKIIVRNIVKINQACFNKEMQDALAIVLPTDDKVLVHGDLYSRHLMFNEGKLTGIIDWGDVGINNRAVDLAVIFSFYSESAHHIFFDIYGAVEPNTWHYARFLGLHSALTLILYAHDMGDSLLVTEAVNALKRINLDLLID